MCVQEITETIYRGGGMDQSWQIPIEATQRWQEWAGVASPRCLI